ncbi:MAG: DUF3109 family protein [Melioribacter sp.]|nr:DUF3109 family protein [Melioribacter sp.]
MNIDFVEIEDVMVNSEVWETNFECDLAKCKGACCTMESKFGAPLKEEEIDIINKFLPIIKEYLPKEHINEIEKKGFWFEAHGEFMTRSLNNKACVFVSYDGDIAKCGIEKAYRDGKIDFIKPISCHLFPIRVSNFGGYVLRFEKYSECLPALQNGNKKILDFCRSALERAFGKDWFLRIKKVVG